MDLRRQDSDWEVEAMHKSSMNILKSRKQLYCKKQQQDDMLKAKEGRCAIGYTFLTDVSNENDNYE